MVFADDVILCSENREEVQTSLEKWRQALESSGMKINRSKTEYMILDEKSG